MKIFELTITGKDACEDVYVVNTPHACRRDARAALLEWLAEYAGDDNGDEPAPGFKALTPDTPEDVLRAWTDDYFGGFEVECGPQDWTITEREVADIPFTIAQD